MQEQDCKADDCARAALVFLCACMVNAAALGNQFALDDLIHVVNNTAIRNADGWVGLFVAPMYPGNLFRPLTTFSYALTFHFFELGAFAYHLTNIILHAAVSAQVYCLLVKLGLRRLAPAAALLFAFHPIHVEAVANVSGRAELLAAFFGLLSLHFSLKAAERMRPLHAVGAALTFLAALLSKESAMVFPLLAMLCLSVRAPEVARNASAQRFVGLLLGAAAVLFVVWRTWVVGNADVSVPATEFLDNPLVSLDAVSRIPIALALLGKYAALCLVPFPLSADYSYAVIDPYGFWLHLENWAYAFIAAALVAIAAAGRQREAGFFSCWFLLSFVITANVLFPIGTIFAERLAYVPSIGMIALLGFAIQRYTPPKLGLGLLALMVLAYAGATKEHSKVWANNENLHRYQMTVSPHSAKTLVNYGMVLRNNASLDAASENFRRALGIYPHFANAAYGIGSVYLLKGLFSGAEHWFYEALKIYPSHVDSLEALGRLYLNNGKNTEARMQFEKMLNVGAAADRARLGLLAVSINEGKWDEARTLSAELASRFAQDPDYVRLKKHLEASAPS